MAESWVLLLPYLLELKKAKSLDMIGKITTLANTDEYSVSDTISIGIVILAKDLPKSHRFYDENLIYIW